MKLSTAVGGLAGAAALTIINQGVSQVDKEAPRLDLLGMNAVAKVAKPRMSLSDNKFFPLALGGDLISNSLYYAMAKGKTPQQTLLRGALLGLGAGISALVLPQRMGLNASLVNRTTKTKVMTVAWYIIGGLVAASAINLLESKNSAAVQP
jgi:hypothetical protein